MNTLIIAEKPSVGRDIARVVGAKAKGNGFLCGGGFVVSWAIGHLVSLAEPEDYDPALKRWREASLPIVPQGMRLKPINKTQDQLNVLRGLLAREDVREIVCATDSGREGELIFRYIYLLLECKKPFKRLWISSMTDDAIREGLAKMRDGSEYDNLFKSARCRSEADWLVGINATRAFTLRYGTLLSVGRVQTPTLALLAAKQKEIDAFVSKQYYEVCADFKTGQEEHYQGTYFEHPPRALPSPEEVGQKPELGDARNTQIDSVERAGVVADAVKGRPAEITEAQTQTKRQSPPLLYDLTELQREANRRYGYTAAAVLETAQALYEKRKLITYPRTDSRHLSTDIAPKLEGILRKLEYYQEFVASIPANGIGQVLRPGGRVIDDGKVSDHHAIIPTGARASGLSAAEQDVYDLLVRRFIQVFLPEYIYEATTLVTRVTCKDESYYHFLSHGKVVVQHGWVGLNPPAGQKPPKEAAPLPKLETGQHTTCIAAKAQRKKTQPPKAFTEATLLSAMEHAGRFVEDEELRHSLKEGGLGTPATRASIIERLIQVGYVRRAKKTLAITPKGAFLIDVVPAELKTPETTGRWEKGLGSIAQGKLTSERFMQSIERYVCYIVDFARNSSVDAEFQEEDTSRKRIKG